MHPTTHSTSPDALRKPARQYPLPFSSCPTHTLTCVTRATLSQEHIGVGRPRGEAERRLYSAHRLHLRFPSPVARLSSLAKRSGRVGRCGPHTHPCESRPRACSLAARSAVQWPHLPPPLRPSLLWPQARLPSSRQKQLADCSACPCDRARPARRRICSAWRGRLLERNRCCLRALEDRASGGTLGRRHEGSAQPASGALRARVASRECTGLSHEGASILPRRCECACSRLPIGDARHLPSAYVAIDMTPTLVLYQ